MFRTLIFLFLFAPTVFGQTAMERERDFYNCDTVQITEPELRLELLAMAEVDQEARVDPESDLLAVDKENTDKLSEMLQIHDWLDISMVGCDGSDAAWLIAQHADFDLSVQGAALERLEAAVSRDQATPSQLAYLTDRVRVNRGQKQVYGTQFHTVDGELVPQPIENRETVDERRAAVGLTALAEYSQQMKELYGEGD